MISPTAIIDYLRLEEPEILQNPEKVRIFLSRNFPNLDFKTAASVDRLARKYRNKETPLETKLKYNLVTFPNQS